MTMTLERPPADVMYPVLKPVSASTVCVRCWRIGRVEWLSDGTVRALHHGLDGNYICILQLPVASLPNGVTERGRALFLFL